jgi:endoglucanase
VTACVVLVLSGAAGSRPDMSLFRAPQQIDSSSVSRYPRLAVIAKQPQFTWLGERDGPAHIRALAAAAGGRLLPLVLYGIPSRDAEARYSAGGAESSLEYRGWVAGVARALGRAPAIVVVEPDALAQA